MPVAADGIPASSGVSLSLLPTSSCQLATCIPRRFAFYSLSCCCRLWRGFMLAAGSYNKKTLATATTITVLTTTTAASASTTTMAIYPN